MSWSCKSVLDLDGRVAGILPWATLLEARRMDAGPRRDAAPLRDDAPLGAALEKEELGTSAISVGAHGQLVGLLTAQNIEELVKIRAARAQLSPAPPPRRSLSTHSIQTLLTPS